MPNENPYRLDPEMANRRPVMSSFTTVPDWVLFHPDLGQIDRAVYLVLSYHADNSDGTCHPGQKLLMREAGISNVRTLRHALARLAAVGAVVVEQSEGGHNTYRLMDRCIGSDRAEKEA